MSNEDILQIYNELKKVNSRLNQLEAKVGTAAPSYTPPTPMMSDEAPKVTQATITTPSGLTGKLNPEQAGMREALGKSPTPAAKAQQDFYSTPSSAREESLSTGSIIGAIGIICFIFGAALIVHMAIQNGWLTPFRQWGLVGLLGMVMSGVGLYFKDSDNEYLSYISSASTVVLYFAAYSGSQIFNIYSPDLSILLVALVTCYCLWLHQYFQNQFFGITAAIGTYVAPILLGHVSRSFEAIAAYFVIWTLGFSIISAWFSSRTLTLLAAYLGIGIFAVINLGKNDPSHLMMVVAVQAIQFATLVAGVVYYTLKNDEPMSETEVWNFFPALLFFYGTEYHFLNQWVPGIAPWISLGFAGFLLVAHRFAASSLPQIYELNSGKMIGAFSSIVLFHSVYLNLLPDFIKPYLIILIVGVAIYFHTQKGIERSGNGAVFLVFGLICLIEFSKICFDLYEGKSSMILLPAIGTLVSLFAAYGVIFKEDNKDYSVLFLWIIHFLAVLSLYNLTRDIGSLAVSISWGLYAAIILGVSYSMKDWVLNKSSIVVLLLAAFKALIYDAANASAGVRIACLLMTGALLYGAGFLFRKASSMQE